jgi:hypothetical protein
MKKEFVPYELALRMKQLGFNEPCIAFYTQNAYGDGKELQWFRKPNDCNSDYVFISAPLYQQAFKWFREKYHIIGEVKFKGGKTTKTAWYDYLIYSEIDWDDKNPNEQWKKYEEAELACLEKLIEIVEQKENEQNQ